MQEFCKHPESPGQLCLLPKFLMWLSVFSLCLIYRILLFYSHRKPEFLTPLSCLSLLSCSSTQGLHIWLTGSASKTDHILSHISLSLLLAEFFLSPGIRDSHHLIHESMGRNLCLNLTFYSLLWTQNVFKVTKSSQA